MTCIVALIHEGVPHFAGDSLVVNTPSQYNSNVSQTVRKEPKVWAREGILFGANGSTRMLQLLRYVMEIPILSHPDQDSIEYLVTRFVPALQSVLLEDGYDEGKLEGNILIALRGELFTIGTSFQICDTADGYDSVGKASEVAIGSLHTTKLLNLPPQERLFLALKAAEHHTCVVSEPFMWITSDMGQPEILLERT